jgi:hypothetical protein
MHRIVFLIIGLSALSFQAQAEDVITVLEESPPSIETDTITNAKDSIADETPVVIITDEPVGVSMQEALAAPEDPYVADDDSESPDEADEDGEEDEEDGNDESDDEEE